MFVFLEFLANYLCVFDCDGGLLTKQWNLKNVDE